MHSLGLRVWKETKLRNMNELFNIRQLDLIYCNVNANTIFREQSLIKIIIKSLPHTISVHYVSENTINWWIRIFSSVCSEVQSRTVCRVLKRKETMWLWNHTETSRTPLICIFPLSQHQTNSDFEKKFIARSNKQRRL